MDTNIEEIYAVFGELVAVQGVTLKRLNRQLEEVQEKLMLSQRQVKKLEENEGK